MKRTILILVILLIGINAVSQNVIFAENKPFSKSVTNPHYELKGNENLYISNIETSDKFTAISFTYRNMSEENAVISLSRTGPTAYYIKANGRPFKLLDYQNIGGRETPTIVYPGGTLNFYTYFEPLPHNVTKFDLIEKDDNFDNFGNFGFTGISMQSSAPNVGISRINKDYNYSRRWRARAKKWEESRKANNTFVFNINDKRGIVRITDNGQIIVYHIESVRKVSNENPYQHITVIDKQNQSIVLDLYENMTIGLVIRGLDGSAIQLYKK